MSPVHPQCPLINPIISIVSYTAESDVVHSPDHKHAESRHRRLWQYFNTGNVFNAQRKVCLKIQQEMERLSDKTRNFVDPESQYQGLKLFFEYRLNEDRKGNKGKVYRFYLFDGEGVSQTELLERIEQEAMFLVDAGNIFKRIEVEDGEGRVFTVAAEGMVLK